MRNIDLESAYKDIYENRRAARAAGGYKDDSPKQTDPSKDGFTGISGSISQIMKQNKEIEAKNKAKKEETAVDGEQLDEAIPAIAGAMAKTAAKAAAGAAASNMVDKAMKPKKTNEEVEELDEEGKKDACYNKVKSRYKVWPSAYASGALVKCRQKGAKNWGNSSKKEEVEFETEESTSYTEGYMKLPAAKMQDKAAMKPDTAKGEKQARKMDVVRKATEVAGDEVKSAVKGQEMANKKRGLEKRFAMPSAKNAEQKKAKNMAYKLENQRRQDLNKRYGPKKEELEAVFATLIGEGIAHDEESAINILTHMSDEWYESIVESILSEGYPGHEEGDSFAKKGKESEKEYYAKKKKEKEQKVPF